jgi:AraC family transcriptional regulator of adaptative response/methylated-DNA-[protein]-cysteine methyltransferase
MEHAETRDSATNGRHDRPPSLPPEGEMWAAFSRRDADYDGIFVTAVATTGIFCRPSCPARKPARENVAFYATPRDALFAGYRACKRCRPMEAPGTPPAWLRPLLEEIDADPSRRIPDRALRERGLDPARVRRWFKRHHGMTFHAYQRARRLGRALRQLDGGHDVTRTAYENGYESLSGFSDALKQLTGAPPAAARGAGSVRLARIETPLGPMLAGESDRGLCLLEFVDRRMLETQLQRVAKRLDAVLVPGRGPAIDATEAQLHEYFDGRRQDFDLDLDLRGTDFQRQVWEVLLAIPFGETRSYGDQARAIGRPTATRAVARANGDNRIAIVVPCHRVVGADGTLTGYGGGLWRKRRLLELEGAMEGSLL